MQRLHVVTYRDLKSSWLKLPSGQLDLLAITASPSCWHATAAAPVLGVLWTLDRDLVWYGPVAQVLLSPALQEQAALTAKEGARHGAQILHWFSRWVAGTLYVLGQLIESGLRRLVHEGPGYLRRGSTWTTASLQRGLQEVQRVRLLLQVRVLLRLTLPGVEMSGAGGSSPGAAAKAGKEVEQSEPVAHGLLQEGPVFYLLARRNEWDEVLILLEVDARHVLALTTEVAGENFVWVVVEVLMENMRAPVRLQGVVPPRGPPDDVDDSKVNWLCVPPDAGVMLDPTTEQLKAFLIEADVVHRRLTKEGVAAEAVTQPGAEARCFPTVGPPVSSVAGVGARASEVAEPGGYSGGGRLPAPTGIQPGRGPTVPPAAVPGGLGFPSGAREDGEMSMAAMAHLVNQMRDDMRRGRAHSGSSRDKKHRNRKDGRRESSEKRMKKDKRDKKDKKKEKRKQRPSRSRRRRRGGSSRSTSSSSATTRSSNSGSSSDHYLRWGADGRNKKVDTKKVQRFASKRFEDQGDVIAFAVPHPGALTAHFLQMVHQRFSQPIMRETREMRSHSPVDWATHFNNLSDIRDQKEIMTLCLAMDPTNARKLETAMDVLAQRINAVQATKSKGGSWEKAAKIELTLLPGQTSSSSGLLRLTM